MQMIDPAPEGESLQDLVSRISDVLRFVFDQHRDDMVVLVGDDEVNRALLSQLQDKAPPAAPRTLAEDAYAINATDIVSGRTRIRRINETLHVVP
jgi:broad specificity phosphatase PhoE